MQLPTTLPSLKIKGLASPHHSLAAQTHDLGCAPRWVTNMYCLTCTATPCTAVLLPVLPLQVSGGCPGPVGVICRGRWGQGASHLPPAIHHAGELLVVGGPTCAAAWDLGGCTLPCTAGCALHIAWNSAVPVMHCCKPTGCRCGGA
jgi:hypothetical protein